MDLECLRNKIFKFRDAMLDRLSLGDNYTIISTYSCGKFLIFVLPIIVSASTVDIRVPPLSPSGARPVDPHIGSLSIESCYITDYFGEPGQRNELSWNLLTNFAGEFGDLNPYLRLGGYTEYVQRSDVLLFGLPCSHARDGAEFDPNKKEALTNTFAAGNDEAINVT
jgi:hypothetical protein